MEPARNAEKVAARTHHFTKAEHRCFIINTSPLGCLTELRCAAGHDHRCCRRAERARPLPKQPPQQQNARLDHPRIQSDVAGYDGSYRPVLSAEKKCTEAVNRLALRGVKPKL